MGTVIHLSSRLPARFPTRSARPLAHLDFHTLKAAYQALNEQETDEPGDDKVKAALKFEIVERCLEDR